AHRWSGWQGVRPRDRHVGDHAVSRLRADRDTSARRRFRAVSWRRFSRRRHAHVPARRRRDGGAGAGGSELRRIHGTVRRRRARRRELPPVPGQRGGRQRPPGDAPPLRLERDRQRTCGVSGRQRLVGDRRQLDDPSAPCRRGRGRPGRDRRRHVGRVRRHAVRHRGRDLLVRLGDDLIRCGEVLRPGECHQPAGTGADRRLRRHTGGRPDIGH
ncbi:MAG: hypothetical protein AVDCRST_MAG49-1965, partial [uncultured Thermomicrobiales bacterium]